MKTRNADLKSKLGTNDPDFIARTTKNWNQMDPQFLPISEFPISASFHVCYIRKALYFPQGRMTLVGDSCYDRVATKFLQQNSMIFP